MMVTIMVNWQSISSQISPLFFPPKADSVIESLTIPADLPYDFKSSLSVSSEYYIATSANMKDTPYQGDPLQIRISFQNMGKKAVQQPRITIYVVDYMYRIWGQWNHSITSSILTNGYILDYHFPPLDQKIRGAWSVFVLLYDDANSTLVSYIAKEIMVTDVAPIPFWQETYVYVLVVYIGLALVVARYQKRLTAFVKRFSRKTQLRKNGQKKLE